MKCLFTTIVFFCLCYTSGVNAQVTKKEVSGRVTDEKGQVIQGVNVINKSSQKATATNEAGYYVIPVESDKSILEFSYVGMVTKTVLYNGQDSLNVKLKASDDAMSEIVVIGYETVKRKNVTGAISSIKGSELNQVPVPNVIDALRGKVPGLVVSTASGAQDADITVRVRGGTSITQDNSPLYIVDGFPMENGFRGLNPNDIENIDILKDASSTAIYGSRGANGVIVITTKSGKEGRNNVSYDMYYGFKKMTRRVPVLSPMEFVLYDLERSGPTDAWQAIYGPVADIEKNYANRPGIDWQELMYGDKTATNQMHRLSLDGGNKTSTYSLSYTFNNDGNIMPSSGYSTHSLRLTLGQWISKKIKIGANVNYFTDDLKGVGAYQENGRNLLQLIQFRPTVGIQGKDEDLITNDVDPYLEDDNSVEINPLVQIQTQIRKSKQRRFIYGFSGDYTISSSLSYKLALGMSRNETERSTFYTARSSQAKLSNGPYGDLAQSTAEEYFANHTLSFRRQFGKSHNLSVLAGQEVRLEKGASLVTSAGGFPEDNFGIDYFDLASIAKLPTSSKSSSNLISFFGRTNYELRRRYILSLTFRADGSTKFGANNKWGYFPSAAFAWLASDEKFLKKVDFLSNLKFRLSYGMAGNNRVGNYRSLALYTAGWTPINNSGQTIFLPSLPNSNLKWEVNISGNAGVDIGLFKNRILATVDVYDVKTKDLLLEARIPYTSGFTTALRNIGSTRNRGVELGLQTRNIENKNFKWTSNFNLSFNKNKVLKLADSERWEINSNSGGNSGTDFVIEVGKSLGLMYGMVYDGLYQANDFTWNPTNSTWVLKEGIPVSSFYKPEPGVTKYKDLNGDGILDRQDQTFIGNANPRFTGGLMNTFSYKNIDLSFFFEYKYKGDIYNANLFSFIRSGTNKNTTKDIYDRRYKTINSAGENLITTGNVEALNQINANAELPSQRAAFLPFDSYMVEDGSYIRLNQLTLGYSLPENLISKIKLKRFRIYATAHNLLTITGYSGFDPEVSMNKNGGLTPGIDRGSHPRSASYVIGANVSF